MEPSPKELDHPPAPGLTSYTEDDLTMDNTNRRLNLDCFVSADGGSKYSVRIFSYTLNERNHDVT